MGEILGGAFSAVRKNWKALVGVILAVQGIGMLLVALAVGIAVVAALDRFAAVFDLPPGETPAGEDVTALLLAFVPAGVLLVVTLTFGAAMFSALGPAVVQEAVVGRTATFGAMWRRCWSRLPAVLGTVLLTALLAGGPMLLVYAVCVPLAIMSSDGSGPSAALIVLLLGVLVCLPFSLWLMTRLGLAPAVAVCEGLGAVASLRRSAQLVKDGWWRVFGISMLGSVVAMAVGYAIQMPFSMIGMAAFLPIMLEAGDPAGDATVAIAGLGVYVLCILLGGLASGIFQFGFPPLVLGLLYVDLRIRKENLAESLMAATAPADVRTPAAPQPPADTQTPPPPAAPEPDQR
ncbi:oxidoreductase [Streptomyces sp. NPDC054987]